MRLEVHLVPCSGAPGAPRILHSKGLRFRLLESLSIYYPLAHPYPHASIDHVDCLFKLLVYKISIMLINSYGL